MRRRRVATIGGFLVLAAIPGAMAAQIPLGANSARGLTVTPAFEGWYRNADGTFTISFGYFNRNFDEILDIPLGPDNRIEPARFDGAQPTHFAPRRHWGVFAVQVPATFGEREEIVWTLRNHGKTFTIPASLHPSWEIDALAGEAGSGNTPPVLRFAPDGPEGQGPAGIHGPALRVPVGRPLAISVWAQDDGRASGSVVGGGREAVPVSLTWFKHQGPGDVTFSVATAQVEVAGGSMTTMATFSAPGQYLLRVRANDASGVESAGHAQCCWTNGFVQVTVTR